MATWDVIAGTPTLSNDGEKAAFSPDGAYLAVASSFSSPYLTVIDTSDWSVVAGIPTVPNDAWYVAFSPDGAYLAVVHSSSPGVTVIDTSDWSVVAGTPSVAGTGRSVAFSTDSAYLAVAHTSSPHLTIIRTADWGVETGTPVPPDTGWGVDFSSDGQYLAVAHSDAPYITVIDTSDWSIIPDSPTVSGNSGMAVTFSTDSSYMAVRHTASPRLTMFNTSDWSTVSGIPVPTFGVLDFDFSVTDEHFAIGHGQSPNFLVLDTSDWSTVSGTPSLPGDVNGVTFSPDNNYLALAHQSSPYLTILEGPGIPSEMHITLADTAVDIQAEVDPAGNISVALGSTTADLAGEFGENVLLAQLGGVTAAIAGDFFANVADATVGLGGTRANMAAAHGPYANITLSGGADSTLSIRDVQRLTLQSLATTEVETFYNPQQEVVAEAAAELLQVIAYVEALTLDSEAAITANAEHLLLLWLRARAEGALETDLQLLFVDTLAALAGDDVVGAAAAVIAEVGDAEGSVVGSIALEIMDDLAAELTAENVLLVAIEETLEAEAGDSVQALGSYIADVKDMAGSWLVFKVSGEVVQGWVMNLEGDRPFSEYSEFDFNSMTRIGSNYFAASDAGLHMLGGDTDGGEQIDSRLSSMMLDFDTTAQKRVVAAYLGYTSDGTVVLKVRSVDDGQLVEHWYEAAEVTADAPRDGYRPLGRGLKSRYWQFELANVDGSDFEIDKLELQPIKLSRRV